MVGNAGVDEPHDHQEIGELRPGIWVYYFCTSAERGAFVKNPAAYKKRSQ